MPSCKPTLHHPAPQGQQQQLATVETAAAITAAETAAIAEAAAVPAAALYSTGKVSQVLHPHMLEQ
jgi:hypothetical protein